jgi:hypothetical protein
MQESVNLRNLATRWRAMVWGSLSLTWEELEDSFFKSSYLSKILSFDFAYF